METLSYVAVAVLGAVIGSFLNVVILRLPEEGASLFFPASHCPHCGQPLRWYENIPLLSYVLLLGRCRTCTRCIAWQYPLVEAAMALLLLLVYQQFGVRFELLIYGVFCTLLLVIIFIDIHHQIIPDRLSLPGIILGFGAAFANDMITWQQSALGILVGGGVLYLVAWGYQLVAKREGMGGGDIKLLAMIGAFLGWQSLLYVVFASSLIGGMVGMVVMGIQKKGWQVKIPYGPFLVLAALSYLFGQEQIRYLWQMWQIFLMR